MVSYKQRYALEMSQILLILKFFIEVDCKWNDPLKIHIHIFLCITLIIFFNILTTNLHEHADCFCKVYSFHLVLSD